MGRDFTRGSSQYLSAGSNLGITTQPFTWACRFRPDTDGYFLTLLSQADVDDTDPGMNLAVRGNVAGDPVQGYFSGTAWSTSTGVTFGSWHHAALVSRGSTDHSVYLDGGSRGDSSASFTPTNWDNFRVGAHADSTPGNYFDGVIDWVAAWDEALSDPEIAALAKDYHPFLIRPHALRAFYPLDAGHYPQNDNDYWSNAYHLTASGSPSWAASPGGLIYPSRPQIGVPAAESYAWPGSLVARARASYPKPLRRRSRLFLAPYVGPAPFFISAARKRKAAARRYASQVLSLAALRGKWYLETRGKYRVFNDAEYRFYRSNSGPPAESDTPFATASSLPATPSQTFGDGTWYLSMSYFDGVLDSGFLPIGTQGETYLVLEISGGSQLENWPLGPIFFLSNAGGGAVRISAWYYELPSDTRADEFAIAYTTDGSTPPTDTPDITQSIGNDLMARLEYDLPAQSHGTTVKVRVQVRRDDGSWVYSQNSAVNQLDADAEGPAAPLAMDSWLGPVPEDL